MGSGTHTFWSVTTFDTTPQKFGEFRSKWAMGMSGSFKIVPTQASYIFSPSGPKKTQKRVLFAFRPITPMQKILRGIQDMPSESWRLGQFWGEINQIWWGKLSKMMRKWSKMCWWDSPIPIDKVPTTCDSDSDGGLGDGPWSGHLPHGRLKGYCNWHRFLVNNLFLSSMICKVFNDIRNLC